ncbi:MAG: tetratricopeptide repeat protein [Proteobacteria bacterium]|nr:tetratricopeptide repeat protein [Pseudomonadota bacterium]
MAELTVSKCLGMLQQDPDDESAFVAMSEAIASGEAERIGDQPVRLLELARQGHEQRGNIATVARLIEAEIDLVQDDRAFQVALWKELGRLHFEELLDPKEARRAYKKALELSPEGEAVVSATKRLEQVSRSWREFAKRFVEEAAQATDVSLKTSLLARAASLVWQFRKKGRQREADKLFRDALRIDPSNTRATVLWEQTLRVRGQWAEIADVLVATAKAARTRDERIGLYRRAARVLHRKLDDKARATECYERVLDFLPTDSDSLAFVAEHLTETEQWDRLVHIYDEALRVRQKIEAEEGILLQIAMLHWRKRDAPQEAEPYFARLRKLVPSHPVMLSFYRDFLPGEEDLPKLLAILTDAQRIAGDAGDKLALAIEIARAAHKSPGTRERSIDAWKIVQRLDPGNAEACRVLKQLYRDSQKWNALVEVLKTEIEGVADTEPLRRVELLRELLAVYRDNLKLDVMVVNTYNAILKLVPDEMEALTALTQQYERMGRWNDLIQVLTRRAQAIEGKDEKIATYLRVARLWIERFANHNQATSPLESVLALDHTNREALDRLKEIYTKKRAWRSLYDVLSKELESTDDPSVRLDNTLNMAKLAAERLHRHEQAVELWRQVLELEPTHTEAVAWLEKLAERQRNWPVLADALERRVALLSDDRARVKVLQRLGGLYAEQLDDPEASTRAWRQVLEIEPRNGRALRTLRDRFLAEQDWDGLQSLYGEAGDWETLVDVFGAAAERTDDPKLRIELSLRAARIFEDQIGEPKRAFRNYERVLGADPGNVRAARALAPIYEQDEKWSRLVGVLEIVAAHLRGDKDSAELIDLLERLRGLSLEELRDSEAAFAYAAEAYRLAPARASTRSGLEAVAERAGAFERLLEVLLQRADEAPEDEAVELRRRAAAIASERLERSDVAVTQLKRVLESTPKDEAVLATLEDIYRSGKRQADLRDLLLLRAEHSDDQERCLELLGEAAELEEKVLGEPKAAIGHLEQVLEQRAGDLATIHALDRLLVKTENWPRLAEILRRRQEIEARDGLSIEITNRLGTLLADSLDNPEAAIEEFARVLEISPGHGQSVAALEKLSESHPDWAPAARRLLERAYEHSGRYDKLAALLRRRLEVSRDEQELRELRLQLAEISGSKLGDVAGAYGALEAAFRESPSDVDLWDRLYEAAERAGQHDALASAYAAVVDSGELGRTEAAALSARVAQLYDEALGEPHAARRFHQRVLDDDPLNESAFMALKKLHTDDEEWDQLQELYRKRIEDTVDPPAKLELLLQLCFLFEEILDLPERAIEAYQQVLELDPDHASSLRTLEHLYERSERWDELIALLRRQLDQAEGQDAVDLLYRLGSLNESKLGDPALAVDRYESVLLEAPTHLKAQQALERLLGVSEQRQRVAAILEPIYESQGACAELVRVLGIQLEAAESRGARVDNLLRSAQLHEHRLQDQRSAFEAYARAVEADPAESRPRQELDRLAGVLDRHRDRAAVLEKALAGCETVDLRTELLLELAVLWDERLQDIDATEYAYERLMEADPDNRRVVLDASRALERIHMQKGDHARLTQDLRQQVRFEDDPQARGHLLSRLADLYEEVLDDFEAATSTQRERLDNDPSDVHAMRGLERLLERTGRWKELIEVLQNRDVVTTNDAERRDIIRKIGSVYEEQLEDRDHAISAYNEIVGAFGPDRDTLLALMRLHEASEHWQELLDCIQMAIELAHDQGELCELRFRAGELMRIRTGEPERAIEMYEEVLTEQPEHAGALNALDQMMQDAGSELRLEAARVAAPRYQAAGDYDKLLSALEVLADTDDPIQRLDALRRAAEVADAGAGDASRAFTYVGEAVRVGASEPEADILLRELQRLAEMSGRFAQYVELLQQAAPDLIDADLQIQVWETIAAVAQQRLGDAALAREYYNRLIEHRPGHQVALDALEELSASAGDHAALVGVLRHKAELASDPDARHTLLLRQADILERALDDLPAAIEALEEVSAESDRPEAFEALERLYTAQAAWIELATLYERELARKTSRSGAGDQVGAKREVVLHHKLAETLHRHLDDTYRALDHCRSVLEQDNAHAPTVELVEELMRREEFRALAAEILEPGYLARREWPKVIKALDARVADESDPKEQRRLLVRLAHLYEDQLEDLEGAMTVHARLLRADPRNEEVWETLTRLAKHLGAWSTLSDVFEQVLERSGVEDAATAKLAVYAGRICSERMGDLPRAGRFLARALAFDPADRETFEALESVYKQTSANQPLLVLYREQVDLSEADDRRVKLLRSCADLQRSLGEIDAAAQTYREMLDVDPADEYAIAALDDLLREAERWAELTEHIRYRIEEATGTPEEIEQKFRLADLLASKLDEVTAAIDVYEEITEADPAHEATISALELLVRKPEFTLRITGLLEPLYRQGDQWKKLIAIYEGRAELLDDPEERFRLLAEIADLHEGRGASPALAFAAWTRALVVDPGNERAIAEVSRLADSLHAWDEQVAACEQALEQVASDASVVPRLLAVIARVHDEKRNDPRAAIATYERLLEADPADSAPLDALEALQTMVGEWGGLVNVLQHKIERSYDPTERGELLRRIGSVREELLGDHFGAVEAYRLAVQEDDADVAALEALDRLYAAGGDTEGLSETLRRRIELSEEPSERAVLGLRLGQVQDELLRHPHEAIEAYRRVLEDQPTNAAAIRALARLFEREGMWPELLDNLKLRAGTSDDATEQLSLRHRAGEILERELDDELEAIAMYQEALTIDPTHEPSIAALFRIAQLADYRMQAAEILDPLLEQQRRWNDLAQLLAGNVEASSDPTRRRDELKRLAHIQKHGLGDLEQAFESLSSALSEDPGNAEIADELEQLAHKAGKWEQAADLFASRATAVLDPSAAVALYKRLARIAHDHLDDDGRAIEAYRRALEQGGETPELLEQLDRLYVRAGRWDDLAELLEQRVAVEEIAERRTELLVRLGELRQEHSKDPAAAFAAFQEVLEVAPTEARALSGLEKLIAVDDLAIDVLELLDSAYRRLGAMDKVVALYEVRLRKSEDEVGRMELLREAARLWEDELGDNVKALAAVRQAFELDPGDEELAAELERLASAADGWESLRGLVEQLTEAGDLESSLARDLNLRASGWYAERFGDSVASEACLRAAIKADRHAGEAHSQLVALLRQQGREAELVEALREWAAAEYDDRVRIEYLQEAAELAEHRVGSLDAAAACLKDILAIDEGETAAMDALIRLRSTQERWNEVANLLARRAEIERDPVERSELRHRLGRMQLETLADHDAALRTYEELLDDDPGDRRAMSALESLLQAKERWDDLHVLLQRRLRRAHDPSERSIARVGLARLAEQRFGKRGEAIEQLREILQEEPGRPEALAELSRLLELDERWDELVELLQQRVEHAAKAGDSETELECLLQLAKLRLERLDDPASAVAAYRRVVERAPDHVPALVALARLHEQMQDWEAAASALERLADVQTGADAVSSASRIASIAEEHLGDRGRTEAAMRRVLSLDPSVVGVRERLKAHYQAGEQYAELAELLAGEVGALQDVRQQVECLREVAELYAAKLKDPASALPFLERAAELASDDRAVLLPLCDMYIAADRQRDAIPVLERIIASYGGRRAREVATYQHRLGQALEGIGESDRALAMYDAAFRIDLTNVSILRDLGRLCLRNGDLARAQKTFRALLLQKLRPDDGIRKADVYYHLGDIAARQGDSAKAKSMLRRALSEAKDHAQARELLDSLG